MPNRKAKDLLASPQILGQLSALDKGGYAKTYQAKGKEYRTGLHAAVASLLDSLGLEYDVDVPAAPGSKLTADFLVGGRTAVFVGRGLSVAERRAAKASGRSCVLIEMSEARSDSLDSGLRVADLAEERDGADREEGRLQTIFLDDPSFNFDYAHILPKTEKCSVMHGHTSSALVEMSAARSDSLDSGLRVADLADETDGADSEEGRLQTIFLDDPSFNFDYAHILPKTEKCSVMHGHTSSALVEVVGSPVDGMVVDFNDAKPIIRKAIADLDHKLFISERYVKGRTPTHVDLRFSTVHGDFSLHVPKETTVLLEGEATVENLAQELLRRIAPKMPGNVEAVGVYVYEGLNKGTHLLARLQGRGAEKRRKR